MNINTFDPFPQDLVGYKQADASICAKLLEMGISFSKTSSGRFFYKVTSTQVNFALNLIEREASFHEGYSTCEVVDAYNLKIRQTVELIKVISQRCFPGKELLFEHIYLDNSPVSARCLLNYMVEDRKDDADQQPRDRSQTSNIQILNLSVPNTGFHLMSIPTLCQTNIQQLNLDNCDSSQISLFLNYLQSNPTQFVPSLKKLSFVTSSVYSQRLGSEHLRSLISFFPNLEQLDFTPKSSAVTTFSDLETFESAKTPLMLLNCGHILTQSFCQRTLTNPPLFGFRRLPRRIASDIAREKILSCPFCRQESKETDLKEFKPRIFRIKIAEEISGEGIGAEKIVRGCIVDENRKPLDRDLMLKIHLSCGQITQSSSEDEETICHGCFKSFDDQRRRFYLNDEPLEYEKKLGSVIEDLKL